ncbi:hypothetical protein KIN20_004155 [Parelaphostrongylus tenuis]|uniref:Uncharacterized protein n=1 Tax=Parelaphostrongylus tenuis TaxID=148309 RepID=A0AAD5MQX7_PARTN|nr:hypothetical protein KIN20_004155 [Parelaphostrongylus tenuis]
MDDNEVILKDPELERENGRRWINIRISISGSSNLNTQLSIACALVSSTHQLS